MTRQAKARKATGPPLTGRHKRPITALHTRLVKPSITATAALNTVPDNRSQRPAVGSRSRRIATSRLAWVAHHHQSSRWRQGPDGPEVRHALSHRTVRVPPPAHQ